MLNELNNLDVTAARSKGSFSLLPSGKYVGILKVAYLQGSKDPSSKYKALHYEFEVNGQTIKDKMNLLDRNGSLMNQQDPSKMSIGATQINDLFMCVDPSMSIRNVENIKPIQIKTYNFDAKTDVVTTVDGVVDLIGKPVGALIVERIENKRKQASDGSWVDTPETRELNAIVRFFSHNSGLTADEIANGKTEAKAVDRWVEKNAGIVQDKTKTAIGAKNQATKAKQEAVAVDDALFD